MGEELMQEHTFEPLRASSRWTLFLGEGIISFSDIGPEGANSEKSWNLTTFSDIYCSCLLTSYTLLSFNEDWSGRKEEALLWIDILSQIFRCLCNSSFHQKVFQLWNCCLMAKHVFLSLLNWAFVFWMLLRSRLHPTSIPFVSVHSRLHQDHCFCVLLVFCFNPYQLFLRGFSATPVVFAHLPHLYLLSISCHYPP